MGAMKPLPLAEDNRRLTSHWHHLRREARLFNTRAGRQFMGDLCDHTARAIKGNARLIAEAYQTAGAAR